MEKVPRIQKLPSKAERPNTVKLENKVFFVFWSGKVRKPKAPKSNVHMGCDLAVPTLYRLLLFATNNTIKHSSQPVDKFILWWALVNAWRHSGPSHLGNGLYHKSSVYGKET